MAGFFNNFFKDVGRGAVEGFFGNDYVRDYKHASKTFRTNGYAYTPKFKYLFHVYFDLNQNTGAQGGLPQDQNIGLAVKSVDLPKFTLDLHTMNQYNRTRLVQTKVKYDPITIKFHDDNNNLTRNLWYQYYSYYYKDPSQPDPSTQLIDNSGATNNPKQFNFNARDIYSPDISSSQDWGYIGESTKGYSPYGVGFGGSDKPVFFNSISIYGFNQHNFVQYKLINPIIESWAHDQYNYAEGTGTMENTVTIRYEYVKYFNGALNGNNPSALVKRFGENSHYDRQLSPLSRPGGNATILGQGGLVDAAGGILNDLQNGNILGAVQKGGTAYNTFKNGKLQNALSAEAVQAIAGVTGTAVRDAARNGKFNFPVANSTNNSAPGGISGGAKTPSNTQGPNTI